MSENVRRAREALMEQGIPLEVTYMNHAYETLRWELAPVLAAYAAAETERLADLWDEIALVLDNAGIAASEQSAEGSPSFISTSVRVENLAGMYAEQMRLKDEYKGFLRTAEAERDRLRKALEKIISYNESIVAGHINYRPHDHIAVAQAALQGDSRGDAG